MLKEKARQPCPKRWWCCTCEDAPLYNLKNRCGFLNGQGINYGVGMYVKTRSRENLSKFVGILKILVELFVK